MDFEFPTTAGQLAERFGAELIGDSSLMVSDLAPLNQAKQGALTFFANRKFTDCLDRLEGVTLITSQELVRKELPLTYLVVEEPQRLFAEVTQHFARKPSWTGVSEQAQVHPSAELGPGVRVGAFAVIEPGVRVGANSIIYPHVYVGTDTVVGKDCWIYPRVTILEHVSIGDRVKIYPGTVIGSDGFGLMLGKGGVQTEVPHVGRVVIEDDVRIGALATVDRGTIGETRIGARSKFDDHVHVAHNCQVGQDCVLCGGVALSGSVTLEDQVVIGWQAGIAEQVVVGKGVKIGAQSGASVNLKAGESYFGSPVVPLREALRMIKYFRKLPELFRRIKQLEERIDVGK